MFVEEASVSSRDAGPEGAGSEEVELDGVVVVFWRSPQVNGEASGSVVLVESLGIDSDSDRSNVRTGTSLCGVVICEVLQGGMGLFEEATEVVLGNP